MEDVEGRREEVIDFMQREEGKILRWREKNGGEEREHQHVLFTRLTLLTHLVVVNRERREIIDRRELWRERERRERKRDRRQKRERRATICPSEGTNNTF